jgi:hypothetical protein
MQILQFIKMHLVSLLCGVFAIGFVVVAVLGMSSGTVVKEMQAEISRTGARDIRSLQNNPKNEEIIAQERARGERFEDEYAKTVEEAKRINRREVLMSGVFPEPEESATPLSFKEEYRKTVERLWSKLDAGKLPTDTEIQEEVENVEDLRALEAEQRAEEEGDETGRAPVVPKGPRMPGGRRGWEPEPDPRSGGGRMMPGGRPTAAGTPGPGRASPIVRSDEPKYDPTYRARVSKARNILCYYDEATFHISPLAYETGAPSPEEMWYAQVALWVQEDVVAAIAGLNRDAAARVSDGTACVEDARVKRLVLVRVLGYELPEAGRLPFLAAGVTAMPPNVGGPSLTGRRCNEQYDVVRFVVSVVIDQRDVLQLIDRISRVNFYQCLSVAYEAVDRRVAEAEGYFYGTDPVVKATLEFEGYLAREVYLELMPPPVRKLLGIDEEGD